MSVGSSDLTENEQRLLACFAMYLQRKQSSKYLEIGVYGGGTLKFVKDHAPQIHCTAVDLFEDFIPSPDNTHGWINPTMTSVQNYVGSDVRLLKGDSSIILSQLNQNNEKFDLIFIDGNHTYKATKLDFENSLKLLNENGFIAFHNCSPSIESDWIHYNVKDGGPWQVVMELKLSGKMKCVGEVDRIAVFGI